MRNLQRINLKNVLFILISILTTHLAFEFLTQQSGWPEAHDGLFWKQRVSAYYLHFIQFDFIPIWSSGDCFNLGSPLPLYYHKLFNYICVSLLFLTGNMKISAMLTLMIFALIGVNGIYRCLTYLGLESWSSLFLSLCILFLNYTATQWLVRGASSEFIATMLIPYLILWNIQFIKTHHFRYNLILIIYLIFLAHNVIALYCVYLTLLTVVTVIIFMRPAKKVEILKNGILASALFILLISPFLVLMQLMSPHYDVGKVLSKYNIENSFMNPMNYFYDTSYQWGLNSDSFSVEINLLFWIVLISAYLLFLRMNKKSNSTINKSWLLFLTIVFVSLLILQLKCSKFLYELIPGAEYIQFPWRLLAFIQIIGLILTGLLISKSNLKIIQQRIILGIYLLILIISYPYIWHKKDRDWSWYDKETLELVKNEGVWGSDGEYNPIIEGIDKNDKQHYEDFAKKGPQIISLASGNILENHSENPEALTRDFDVKLDSVSEIALPINYSNLEFVYIQKGNMIQELKAYRTNNDPRIRIVVPKGESTIVVELPTFFNSLKKIFVSS